MGPFCLSQVYIYLCYKLYNIRHIYVLLPSDWINGNSNKISAVLKLCILWQIRGCCWHCATTPHHTLLSRIQLVELAGSMSDFVCPSTAAKMYTGVSAVTTKSCSFTDLASDGTTPEFYKLGTHHLLCWLIAKVQGPLVYLYSESAACKNYYHGLLDIGVIWWCTTSSARSIPQANHVLVYTSTQLPPSNHMPLWYTLYISVWPHTRHSVWLFRCFFIASGSHPDHMSLLLHHSTLSD